MEKLKTTNGYAIIVVIFTSLLLSCDAELTPPSAQFDPSFGGKIAFASNIDGAWDIYSFVLADTNSDLIRLTSTSSIELDVTVSPQGEKIVFSSLRDGNKDIYVIDADGSNEQKLTNNSVMFSMYEAPSWSLDGTQLAFSVLENEETRHIYIMDADGSNMIKVTDDEENHTFPSWSPDGETLVYISGSGDELNKIQRINIDGTGLSTFNTAFTNLSYPSWSPDGLRLIFIANSDESSDQIHIMNTDGSGFRKLTDVFCGKSSYPSWSSDGSSILFALENSCDPDGVGNTSDIYIVKADGTDIAQLTNGAPTSFPSWFPLAK